jgi:hypothetical protein
MDAGEVPAVCNRYRKDGLRQIVEFPGRHNENRAIPLLLVAGCWIEIHLDYIATIK